jgi:hypothetical protein
LLWIKARAALKQAERVTIIGYSFPEYDEAAVECFRNSLQNDAKLHVIDYCEKKGESSLEAMKGKYARLFPALKDVTISLDGLKKYLDDWPTSGL